MSSYRSPGSLSDASSRRLSPPEPKGFHVVNRNLRLHQLTRRPVVEAIEVATTAED
jgi:hypothetical protein